jgi:tetratricopeptide (TPR) repeat protein
VGNVAASPGVSAATAEAAKGGPAGTAPKFVYPAWHKAADRLWNWGLWDEAARLWLKGLKAEDPNAQMVLIADQLTQLQATRQYAAWSPLLPVVALPQSGGNKKRWLLLAVPAAADLARARQFLLLAQGQAATVDSWAQWQKSLASSEVLGMDGPLAPTAQSQAMAVVANRGAAAGATSAAGAAGAQGRAAVPGTLASAAGSAGYAGASAPGAQAPSRARLPTVADAQAESADGAGARDGREPPQLSRTEAERLPASGPVPPTAKAIDVDYQMIEKSLARADHQGALDAATKLEKYIGENWRTQYLSGVALMGLSRWEQAIAALGKAQELNPRHATAALYLSVALQERGEHARAIQVLDKAQQLQPLSPELWLNQGHSHQALGHKAEARKAYNRFLELSVNRQDLAVQRVWVQNRLQKDNG